MLQKAPIDGPHLPLSTGEIHQALDDLKKQHTVLQTKLVPLWGYCDSKIKELYSDKESDIFPLTRYLSRTGDEMTTAFDYISAALNAPPDEAIKPGFITRSEMLELAKNFCVYPLDTIVCDQRIKAETLPLLHIAEYASIIHNVARLLKEVALHFEGQETAVEIIENTTLERCDLALHQQYKDSDEFNKTHHYLETESYPGLDGIPETIIEQEQAALLDQIVARTGRFPPP